MKSSEVTITELFNIGGTNILRYGCCACAETMASFTLFLWQIYSSATTEDISITEIKKRRPNTQVTSFDIITSLCGYSSVNEAGKVCVYVNGGASAI